MNPLNLNQVIVNHKQSIKDVIRNIDHSGLRAAYVVDEKNKLLGVVSDSEIRKVILKGKDVRDSIEGIVNTDPIILNNRDIENLYVIKKTIRKLLNRMPDSRHILIVDEQQRPEKIVLCSELVEPSRKKKKELFQSSKHVLVLGGAGYLGSVLVRKLLDRGYRVKVLDILMFGVGPIEELLSHPRFQLIEGDMRNISTLVRAISDVDAVVNLAALVGDPACSTKPEIAIETNYLSNKILAEACKYHQINQFLYASTCSVYGAMNGQKELDENSPLSPISLYARSKIQAEEGILELEDENFSPTILRMSTLYGYSPRMRFDLVVNAMSKTAVIDKKISVHGGGLQWRPLLHVDDAAESYIRCLEASRQDIKGEIFNVGSREQNYQIRQVGEIVKKCIPDADLLVEGETTDPRNYFVSFNLIEQKLKFKVAQTIEKSVLRIKKAIEDKEIKDVNDSKYYNVEYSQ